MTSDGLHSLSGGGVCGELVRATDWSKTALGPPASWSSALKTTVGILLHTRHPMFLWWGPELVQFYNDAYMPSFGVGKHPTAMGQRGADCWQEIWPIIWPQIDGVMHHGRASWNEDHLVPIFRNGRIEEVYWTYGYSPVYDEDGTIGGTLVVCTETTGRVIAERRIGLAVASEVTEQVRARRALEAADRAKDEFLATMSHELRTPLNAMLGWARMLLQDRRDPAKLAKGLAVIERNASAQARLVSDLLDVSRIISGKLRLATRRIEVAPILHDSIESVRHAADVKRVELVTRIDPDVGMAIADPDRLQQIVWNLLTNAVRFTPAGGTVTLAARRVDSTVRLTVEDTGSGIPKEHLAQIFDRFHQVDGTATREHGGLGLGLSIVRYLVEAHGGAVTAESPGPGRGATFAVTLPTRAVERPEPGSASEPPPRSVGEMAGDALKDARILVVDDETDSLELVRMVLADAGAAVTAATSAKEALAARGPFDLVVSDIGMPNMDGYALLPAIRSTDWGKKLPAIALTAYARLEDAASARRAGYEEHLPKPVDPKHLIRAVARCVRRGAGPHEGA